MHIIKYFNNKNTGNKNIRPLLPKTSNQPNMSEYNVSTVMTRKGINNIRQFTQNNYLTIY